VNSVIVFVAKYFVFLSALVVIAYWLRAATDVKFALGWQLVAGGIVAVALSTVAGHLYYDTRPFVTEHIAPLMSHAPDNGFPSDHALLASFLGFTLLFYSRRIGLLLVLLALLIGAARVAAHIHHPIDIVGSFAIAALAVGLIQAIASTMRNRRSDPPVH
jgi:undecaprenyl-diphosphatase